ncbi:AraC family transcriptional regulator [Pseudomonas sp. Gutcm_11s]|uniref:AraC family transcriptional regulator n=1 Tax=Pseudomonas sp. Gutcm_11s TaxID=3026088 RepID=UPI002362FA0D|nr:AraC family transcriptional regulator [Pseudomonas sp. Gutcm_11s]MDD0843926.1 AraC family transcriptional regulator [Pseudomonas sp. Gutcm_11s]
MARPRRSAVSVQLLTQYGLDLGLSLDVCLQGTGLDWGLLADPGAEVDAEQELRLVRNLVQACDNRTGLGLALGRRYRLNSYGIWGFALLASPTFRAAASLGLRYLDLTYAFHGMRLEEQDEEVHLLLDDHDVPEDLRGFLLERDLSGMLQVLRELWQRDLPILRVELRLPEPADPAPYLGEIGQLPRFAQAHNRFVFPRHLLDLPLAGAHPQAAQLCEEQCQRLLAKRSQDDGLAGRIRALLLARPGRLPDMEQVAASLHMSSRTLRRRLDEDGSNFRLLLDEVRQALAEELLATGGLTLEEIAERLGYGEVSNFIHAFKRWKGVTPRQFQRGAVT